MVPSSYFSYADVELQWSEEDTSGIWAAIVQLKAWHLDSATRTNETRKPSVAAKHLTSAALGPLAALSDVSTLRRCPAESLRLSDKCRPQTKLVPRDS